MARIPKSWGRYPKATPAKWIILSSRFDPLPLSGADTWLPYGNGRSYGDVCQNNGGGLWLTRALNRLIAWNPETGQLRCEAGMLLSDILAFSVPQGWFLPVTPGTQFVTVGGAIANDVHGKNHHVAGTFGCHVTAFELRRSDSARLSCSATANPEWFAATIGGLGLTGLITWAEIRMKRIANPYVEVRNVRFRNLGEYFNIQPQLDADHEYSVAWIDCLATGKSLGRGILMGGNHAGPLPVKKSAPSQRTFTFPIDPPFSLINHASLSLFNALYYRRPLPERVVQHFRPYFYPLDGILEWNRLYGRSGFSQYQCVVPPEHAKPAMTEILERIARAGEGSFLAVLKTFGRTPSPGLLSFPRPGLTVALDFPWRGSKTLQLLDSLDEVTESAGGRVYPAKDARLLAHRFQRYFPEWQNFSAFIDPACDSSFRRRVMG